MRKRKDGAVDARAALNGAYAVRATATAHREVELVDHAVLESRRELHCSLIACALAQLALGNTQSTLSTSGFGARLYLDERGSEHQAAYARIFRLDDGAGSRLGAYPAGSGRA